METIRAVLSNILSLSTSHGPEVPMFTLNRLVIVFLFSLCYTAAFSVAAFPGRVTSLRLHQQRAVKKAPTATVTGRITNNGRGRGGIVVGLRAARTEFESALTFKSATDADGNYRISSIPAGTYTISPLAPSYVVNDLAQFYATGKTLILGEGETVQGIDFTVLRGAVVTGKVTDAEGRPIIDERVSVVPTDQREQQQRRFSPWSNFSTDDRGIYRIYGLPPGKYNVFVGDSTEGFFNTISRGRVGYARAYYADATKPEEPKTVELTEGAEAANIDITVAPGPQGFTATAVVVNGETNQPVPHMRFGIQKFADNQRMPMYGTTTVSNSRGELRYDNLSPGKYAIVMTPNAASDLRSDSVSFDIVNQDVSGLIVKTVKGAAVSGVVVVEGTADKTLLAKVGQSRLTAFVRREGGGPGGYGHSVPLNPDGSFRIGGLDPGFVSFQVMPPNQRMDDVLFISRIERDGIPQPRGLEIKSGEQVSGVKLMILAGTGTVSGTFKLLNGPAPPGTRFLARLVKPGENTFGTRSQEVDARGLFMINNVPSGTYDLVITGFIPESRQRPLTVKQSVTITEGAPIEVEMVLDLNAPRTP